ncbi:MAG: glycosyltransferase family 1 protein [Oscillospiraceae bacterium]|nr:glycosyltransferase family 1 protein [Oscillospiraceae bacterium]
MQDAKIVLNTMTWFKDGTHDRVFNGMLSGAAVFTDSSIYMKESFSDEIEQFELTEIDALPDRISGLLSDKSAVQALADRGRARAKKDCTLYARADELADDLLNAL